jgi:hypothetical protein
MRIRDPVLFSLLYPGWKKYRSGINIPFPELCNKIFLLRIRCLFDRGKGIRDGKIRIRNPGYGINIPDSFTTS